MMEFATENYLSDLLINTESNGFESAKESFYECISNKEMALEGIGNNSNGGGLKKVVGGILLVPVILIGGIILTALGIVAAVIILVGKLITTIIKLPAIIAQAIKNSRVRKEIAEREKAGQIKESRDGNLYFSKVKEYLTDNLQSLKVSMITVRTISSSPIIKFASNKYMEQMYADASASELAELDEKMGQGESAKEMDEIENSTLNEIKELRSKLLGSDVGFNFKVNESEAHALIKTSNAAAKNLSHFKSIIEKYDKKLRNTKDACDKAKANKSTEVSLDNNCAFMDKYLLEMLKLAQVSLKHTGHAVGYISEWARESGRSGYANNKLNEAQVPATTAAKTASQSDDQTTEDARERE